MFTSIKYMIEGRNSSNREHAFLWSNGKFIDLGTLHNTDSKAIAINNKGEVLGESETFPFIWRNGKMIDIGLQVDGPKSNLCNATAMNDRGDIVGRIITGYLIKDGKRFALEKYGEYFVREVFTINNSGQMAVEFSRLVYKSGQEDREFMVCLLTPK